MYTFSWVSVHHRLLDRLDHVSIRYEDVLLAEQAPAHA